MKIALIVVGVLVAVVAIVALIGSLLPRAHQVSRSAVVAGTPAEVFAVLADFEHAPGWRKDVERVETLRREPLQFREHGAGVTITERGEVSNVLFRFLSRYVLGQTKSIDALLAQLRDRSSR